MFQHGFTRAHRDNTSEGVAESYYRVVGEPLEIDGRTFKFGDFVEFKNGRLKVHVPGGVYPDNEGIQVARIVKTTGYPQVSKTDRDERNVWRRSSTSRAKKSPIGEQGDIVREDSEYRRL